jgi:hypothetical protein
MPVMYAKKGGPIMHKQLLTLAVVLLIAAVQAQAPTTKPTLQD